MGLRQSVCDPVAPIEYRIAQVQRLERLTIAVHQSCRGIQLDESSPWSVLSWSQSQQRIKQHQIHVLMLAAARVLNYWSSIHQHLKSLPTWHQATNQQTVNQIPHINQRCFRQATQWQSSAALSTAHDLRCGLHPFSQLVHDRFTPCTRSLQALITQDRKLHGKKNATNKALVVLFYSDKCAYSRCAPSHLQGTTLVETTSPLLMHIHRLACLSALLLHGSGSPVLHG